MIVLPSLEKPPILRSLIRGLILPWLILSAACATESTEPHMLLDGSPKTLAFLGDSITHCHPYTYHLQLMLATRFPGADLWTVNVGRSGCTARNALRERLELEIIGRGYDIVFLHFGMNDVNRDWFKGREGRAPTQEERQKHRDSYRTNMGTLIQRIKDDGARVVVISPTIYDDTTTWDEKTRGLRPFLNEELGLFGKIGAALAAEYGFSSVDVHSFMQQITERGQAKDPRFTIISNDRVHPRHGGSELIALEVFKSLQPPNGVYRVEIDARNQTAKLNGVEFATKPTAEGSGIKFELRETVLPYPTRDFNTRRWPTGLAHTDFQQTLNAQILKVTGLATGDYDLEIDGTTVIRTNDKALADGINLADLDETPQLKLARELKALVFDRKMPLERAVRDMSAQTIGLARDGALPSADWSKVDPDQAVAAIEEMLAAHKEKTGNDLSSWAGYVARASLTAFPKRDAIIAELTEIRKTLAAQPPSRVHKYRIIPVTD